MSAPGPAVSLITGAGSGIGRAAALRLARRGDHLAILDVNADGLAATAAMIPPGGSGVLSACADVTDGAEVERSVSAAIQEFGHIDNVLSNAGTTQRAPVATMTLQQWTGVLETHLTGTFHVCQAALGHMVRRRSGAIVVMSSDFAVVGMPSAANYAAAKTALYSLTKSLALEFASAGVRVNAVGPGPIDTPLLRVGRSAAEWEKVKRGHEARVPMGRLGRPEEVAAVVEFLLSSRSAYMTGQLVQPNGGQVMW